MENLYLEDLAECLNLTPINLDEFAEELALARKEITLQDLTDSQWSRVCNRIANALNKQFHPFEWDEFMEGCGCSEE